MIQSNNNNNNNNNKHSNSEHIQGKKKKKEDENQITLNFIILWVSLPVSSNVFFYKFLFI